MTPMVLAQAPAPSAGGGFDPMTLILLAAFAFLIFMMFRGRKKARTQQEKLQSSLAPGAEVMTQFGLFGTVVAIDTEENKVVLELSPGHRATVHSQAIARVVEPTQPAAAEPADAGRAADEPDRTVAGDPDRTVAGEADRPVPGDDAERRADGTDGTDGPERPRP